MEGNSQENVIGLREKDRGVAKRRKRGRFSKEIFR